ncbi:hypothetical protein E3N88_01619 [Mikania micrantha]|uniref:Protein DETOXIFICATION n=1 Tax=Mikania micrantha TaxID=192012 RepID=A0A5N6Q230_9ASTR|nr:hypothetical protein E3N88_01619 [Mikania micrantha]
MDVAGYGECFGDIMWTSLRGQRLQNVGCVSTTFMDRAFRMLYPTSPVIHLRYAGAETARPTGGHIRALGRRLDELNSTSLQPVLPVPVTKVSSKPAQNKRDRVGVTGGVGGSFGHELVNRVAVSAWTCGHGLDVECLVVAHRFGVVCLHGVRLVPGNLGLENWYYRILIVMTGNLENAKIAVDALSICMSINGFELMIPLGFFAGTGVRVANELGAGNGKGARFATIVSVITSTIIGLVFWLLIMLFHNELALIFTTSEPVLDAVSKLSLLLAFTILLNSVQPVLSGVAVGSGWQSYVAYINLGCYYLVGVPMGLAMGWLFRLGVMGIWAGMIFGGTALQTIVLAIITSRCNWELEVS